MAEQQEQLYSTFVGYFLNCRNNFGGTVNGDSSLSPWVTSAKTGSPSFENSKLQFLISFLPF